ncbi:elongation factor g, domain IV domain-containing protein [Ditylenchus destructor]|uniref:Elongation factor g, domain IV domain-containing protein n=1 Tax=Ditylenchus destructor TaxID=166010 RepID=A0AAD4QRE4_9BILA|nr:elongation factor g, domain IV domain-containing protein [Ditylenchus destructor]
MNKYLEGGELSEEEIKKALRQRTIAGEIQPMLCGSAFKNKGVQAMLDAVVEYMPSPLDIPPVAGVSEDDEPTTRKADDNEKFSALAFKLMTDPFVGQLTFVRVYSGVLSKGDSVYNPVRGKKERIGRIVQMHANNREEVSEIRAGDIAACVGLKDVTTGETLCDPEAVVTLERMHFPEPVIRQAVEPKTKADQEKMGIALGPPGTGRPLVSASTPTKNRARPSSAAWAIRRGSQRGQAASGLPRNHPQQGHRRRRQVRASVRRQGPVWSRGAEDRTPGSRQGLRIRRRHQGRCGSSRIHPAVEKGIVEALGQGVLAGYPVVDVKVTLHFGSYHDVDSNEMAFKMAAIFGFKEGARKANPVILEPMMAVEVETPEDYAGNVMGDLSSRRGMVQGMDDMVGGGKAIKAEVPLSEMFGYSTTLRSMSQGRATYTMEFKHYAEAPRNVAEAIVAARAK